MARLSLILAVCLLSLTAAWAATPAKDAAIQGKTIDGVEVYNIGPYTRTLAPAFEVRDVKWFSGKAVETGQAVVILTGLLVPKGKYGQTDVDIKIETGPEADSFPPGAWMTFKTKLTLPKGSGPVRFAAIEKAIDRPDFQGKWVYTVTIGCRYHSEPDLKRSGTVSPQGRSLASSPGSVRPSSRP